VVSEDGWISNLVRMQTRVFANLASGGTSCVRPIALVMEEIGVNDIVY